MKSAKSNHTHTATQAGSSSLDDIVEFRIRLPKARTVALAGTFNGWNPKRTLLNDQGGGSWHLFLPLNPGRYEYRYVVDGQWQEDPDAKEFSPNPFGGRNAVLRVGQAKRQNVPLAVAS